VNFLVPKQKKHKRKNGNSWWNLPLIKDLIRDRHSFLRLIVVALIAGLAIPLSSNLAVITFLTVLVSVFLYLIARIFFIYTQVYEYPVVILVAVVGGIWSYLNPLALSPTEVAVTLTVAITALVGGIVTAHRLYSVAANWEFSDLEKTTKVVLTLIGVTTVLSMIFSSSVGTWLLMANNAYLVPIHLSLILACRKLESVSS